ncbi:putative cyclin domain-containing protein [Venturia nashicola]|uniref:Putative cyclin domain-containing protein n=1 Tax=Venturia nashicola TaxID=86259 RepID=A0A4Z1P8L1_9PEZI|nr:putative cyclin domain-containing protein [Venturia nashicola]TLD37123.1 putative cyclin domain-containing protein [Venturia nashicola]
MTKSPSHLANPLATTGQLASSGSQLDGVPPDLESSIIFAAARLTHQAGMLLRLPHDTVAQAVVVFTRFWIGSEGGSLSQYSAKDVSQAALYLTAKLSDWPKSPRSLINTYAYLTSIPSTFADTDTFAQHDDRDSYYVSEGTYQIQRHQLAKMEMTVLNVLGYETHVALPFKLCINYLQALEVLPSHEDASTVAKRAFAHLNSALFSPQLLYLTHQPPNLATAAIYLAAREVGVKLPDVEWWEVFDTDREELGFLVVALISMESFVKQEKEKWGTRMIPLTLDDVEAEIVRRKDMNGSA